MKTIEILDRLIAFDTTSKKSNLGLIDFVESLLLPGGFRVTRLPSPCGQKSGLYAEIGPKVAGGLLLSAHTDVVPVTGQSWTRPAYSMTSEDGKLYGRGTTDMKGFLASALALALGASTEALRHPLALLLTYDEEIGCVGLQQIRSAVTPLLRAPALCIVGEPTEMRLGLGHKGKRAYRAVFHGEAGHSALAPRFQNALHHAGDLMSGLRAVQAEIAEKGPFDPAYDIPYSTVHIGKLNGGTALNIVPSHAEMLFEVRHLADQDMNQLDQRILALVAALNTAADRVAVELETINAYPGLSVDPNQPWLSAGLGGAPDDTTKLAFGTEAGILSQMGIRVVVCGPGSMDGQGHKADEFIHADQLAACDLFLERAFARLC